MAARALTAALERHAWVLAAAVALGMLLVLAFVGPERQGALGQNVAAGPMRHVAVDAVRRVQLRQGEHSVAFERSHAGWAHNGQPLPAPVAERLQQSLRLLHNTPPEQRFEAELAEFGLASPSLTIELAADGGAPLTLAFGAANPIGLARYARVTSGPETGLVMLPSDVHDHWLQLLQGASPR